MDEENETKSDRSITNAWSQRLAMQVRERRKLYGLTQEALAETSGVSRRHIIEIEHGKATARLDGVIQVLQTLGLQIRLEDGNEGVAP